MGGNTFLADRAQADWKRNDPGTGAALNPKAGVQELILVAAGETNTLSDPTSVGEILFIHVAEFTTSATRAITAATAINIAGDTVMTFEEDRDNIMLISTRDGSTGFRWEVVANNGVALS